MPTKPAKTAQVARKTGATKVARRVPSKRPSKTAEPVVPLGSKQSQLIALMRSPTGATLEQMTTLTGWQPHSVRGVISGAIRKRLKLNVVSAPDDAGVRVYRIGA